MLSSSAPVTTRLRRLTVPPKISNAVVRAVVRLDVVDGRAAADAAQGQRLQLAVAREHVARVADLHVAHRAAVVGRRRAAEVARDPPRLRSGARRRRCRAWRPARRQSVIGARPSSTTPPHWPCESSVARPSTLSRLVKTIGAVAVPTALMRLPRLTASQETPVVANTMTPGSMVSTTAASAVRRRAAVHADVDAAVQRVEQARHARQRGAARQARRQRRRRGRCRSGR